MLVQRIKLKKNLLDRLSLILPSNRLEAVLHVFSNRRPTTIRANTLKITGWELRRKLLEIGIKADTVFWCKEAFIIQNRKLREIEGLDLYKKGYFYVQSLSSMIPPLVLAPAKNEIVLDIAAAPGSKTTQIAAMMGNTGELFANEPNEIRLQKLEANLNRQGVTNTKLLSMDGGAVQSLFTDYFDKVLVDAPCSGEGRISIYFEDSYRNWSYRSVCNYSSLQKRLLISALLAVKPGGKVVYSTCTLAPEENEGNVSFILEKTEGQVIAEPVILNSFHFSPPIMHWEGKDFHKGVKNCVRVNPSETMEGFFVTVFKRLK
jgi:16S rRNA (cytosine1407-C5)-methyltransferase